jgi:FixJ family two-component response regulator
MSLEDQIVFIVDDDRRICEALSELLSTFDFHVVTFGSAAEYIAYPKPDLPACLILDVELPGLSGLDLQRQIGDENHPQIVFLTGHGDIPSSVRAIRAGAVDFLTKPFSALPLIRDVGYAFQHWNSIKDGNAPNSQLPRRSSLPASSSRSRGWSLLSGTEMLIRLHIGAVPLGQ